MCDEVEKDFENVELSVEVKGEKESESRWTFEFGCARSLSFFKGGVDDETSFDIHTHSPLERVAMSVTLQEIQANSIAFLDVFNRKVTKFEPLMYVTYPSPSLLARELNCKPGQSK